MTEEERVAAIKKFMEQDKDLGDPEWAAFEKLMGMEEGE